jgi:xylulokinase
MGAAILAGVGTGVFKEFEDAVLSLVQINSEYYPDVSTQDAYDRNYEIYLDLYKSLRKIMHKAGSD